MSKSDNQYEKTFLRKLLSFIEERPISTISLIPPLIAGFLVVIWGVVKNRFLPEFPQVYSFIVLSTASIIISLVGLVYLYRKEMPGPTSSTTIKGGVAILSGIVLFLFFCGLGLVGILFAIF